MARREQYRRVLFTFQDEALGNGFENTEATRAARPRGPDRWRSPSVDERQGSDGLRGALWSGAPLREGVQGREQAQLSASGVVSGRTQDQEQPAGARDGERHALRTQGAGGSLAKRGGRHVVSPGPRRCARSATLRLFPG